MKTLKTILTPLMLMTVLYANGQSDLGQIPTKVKQAADSIINLTLGTDYFNKTTFNCDASQIYLNDYLVLNACQANKTKGKQKNKKKSKTELKPSFYSLNYKLTLSDNSDFSFEIRLDNNLMLKEKINLPDCRNTKACEIKVDSLEAIDLAIKSGLEKGLGIYNDGLMYDSKRQTFQWKIKNHLKQGPDQGDLIFIDAISGQRIVDKDRGWTRSVVH